MDGSQLPKSIRVILAQPRGFCAGVERAIDIVERALTKFGPPIYVRHEIVHNRHVVEDLRARGAVFVDELDEVPNGAITVFSAHGVARKVESAAASRELPVIDASGPLRPSLSSTVSTAMPPRPSNIAARMRLSSWSCTPFIALASVDFARSSGAFRDSASGNAQATTNE